MSIDCKAWGARTTADEILSGRNLSGQLFVVTGGAGGIGLAAARALGAAGADVVIGGRTPAKLSSAKASLEESGAGRVMAWDLDLMSQSSIGRFAAQLEALDRPVAGLLANAGVIGPLERTVEGIESGFMTSYVGHAILASDLRRALTRHSGSRFVTVSSFGHHFSPVVFDDINFERREYRPFASYGQSKTASILLAVKLANAWRGMGVDAFSLHPGTIATEVTRSLTYDDYREAKAKGAMTPPALIKTLDQGAATGVFAAVDPSLSGRSPLYLEDCAIASVVDEPNFAFGVLRYALDLDAANLLWEAAEGMLERKLPL